MNGLRVALRWAAGLCGLLLGIGGFYGGYQKLLSYHNTLDSLTSFRGLPLWEKLETGLLWSRCYSEHFFSSGSH